VLQFPVIDICNSQCQMCRIWENKKSDEISLPDLRRGLRNPLFSEVAGVGVNGGEPTLRRDLAELVSILFDELPKLRGISLITNAYKSDEVIARIAEVGSVVRRRGGTFDVMVSIDGVGDLHDLVRGKPGNFERAQKVIEFVQSSDLVTNVRIGCTIIKANVYGLADLLEYCLAKGVYIKYRLGIPHQRLYTQNLVDPYALDTAEKYHVVEFLEGLIRHYEVDEQQKFFYRSLADQLAGGAPRKAGCDWQHRGATITAKGELLYCAVQSKVLGRIQDGNSEQAYFGHADHLREIVDTKCASCNHDYVGIPPKAQYAKQLALRAAQGFGVEPALRRFYRLPALESWRGRRSFDARSARFRAMADTPLALAVAANPSARRVLLCGWYGTETLGDKAILAAVIQALRQAWGAVEFTLVSLAPYVSEMSRRQMTELKGCRIVDTGTGVRMASGADLVAFAGGPLMAIDELAEMEVMFASARAAGVPTLLAGCGVGPLGSARHNTSLRSILSLASVRIYRDESSRELARELGVDTSPDRVADDPAFTWLRAQRAWFTGRPPAGPRVLVLGLRDFPAEVYGRHLGAAARTAASRRYEREILRALEAVANTHPDLVIRPLPMCTNHFGDDDRWFYRRLFRGTPLQRRLDLSLLGAERTPSEYCEAFASAHVALAMRFHSLVFALGLDVPAVAVDYTLGRGKVHDLARRFGVPCQNLAELDAGFLVREVSQLLAAGRPQAQGFQPEFPGAVMQAVAALNTRSDGFGAHRPVPA